MLAAQAASDEYYALPGIVLAIGYHGEQLIYQTTPRLDATDWGTVKTDEHGRTSVPGVFAAGDNVRGADLVVTALADAKKAAAAMDEYLGASTQ